jgi:cell wall-associated NlpC family hydrolase
MNNDKLLEEMIGTPYKELGRDKDGLDCWGFVKYVYSKLGIDLPDFVYTSDGKSKSDVYEKEVKKECWEEILLPEHMCIVAMGKGNTCTHVGLWHKSGIIFHALYPWGVRYHTLNQLYGLGNKYLKYYKWGL